MSLVSTLISAYSPCLSSGLGATHQERARAEHGGYCSVEPVLGRKWLAGDVDGRHDAVEVDEEEHAG